MRIIYYLEIDGGDFKDDLDFDEDTPDDEIEDTVKDLVFGKISWGWYRADTSESVIQSGEE